MELSKQMGKHVEKWQESGLSKSEYASRTGLGYHKLCYWIQKIRTEPENKNNGRFLPIGQSEEKIEIYLKNGITIKLPYNVSQERIKSILEVAGC